MPRTCLFFERLVSTGSFRCGHFPSCPGEYKFSSASRDEVKAKLFQFVAWQNASLEIKEILVEVPTFIFRDVELQLVDTPAFDAFGHSMIYSIPLLVHGLFLFGLAPEDWLTKADV